MDQSQGANASKVNSTSSHLIIDRYPVVSRLRIAATCCSSWLRYVLFFSCSLFLLITASTSHANAVRIDNKHFQLNITNKIQYLEDPSKRLKASDLLLPQVNKQFTHSHNHIIRFGFTDNIIWTRTIIKNDLNREFSFNGLLDEIPKNFKLKTLTNEIYEFFLTNRIEIKKIPNEFSLQCYHINKKVKLFDDSQEFEGFFSGIDPSGAALIRLLNSEKVKKFYSATLRIC